MTPQIFFCWDLSLLQVLRRYLLWNLSEYELVICRPVCRIHGTKFVIMKPIVTFFFCQNLLFDKVTWWLNNNCLFCLTLCFAYCYHRLRDHLLLKPWKISEIFISKSLYKKFVTSAKFCGKVFSCSGVDMFLPISQESHMVETWNFH